MASMSDLELLEMSATALTAFRCRLRPPFAMILLLELSNA